MSPVSRTVRLRKGDSICARGLFRVDAGARLFAAGPSLSFPWEGPPFHRFPKVSIKDPPLRLRLRFRLRLRLSLRLQLSLRRPGAQKAIPLLPFKLEIIHLDLLHIKVTEVPVESMLHIIFHPRTVDVLKKTGDVVPFQAGMIRKFNISPKLGTE